MLANDAFFHPCVAGLCPKQINTALMIMNMTVDDDALGFLNTAWLLSLSLALSLAIKINVQPLPKTMADGLT